MIDYMLWPTLNLEFMLLFQDDTLALGDQVDSLDLLMTRLAEYSHPPHLLSVLSNEISGHRKQGV